MALRRKKIVRFRPKIRSRHPSHSVLRARLKRLPLMRFPSVVRLGSSTVLDDTIAKGGKRVELNTIGAIKNSSNKLLMKQCFSNNDVKTALWWTISDNKTEFKEVGKTDRVIDINSLPYPIIAKSHFGSRGQGNTKIDDADQMKEWVGKHGHLNNYIFEVFHNFNREYRLHVNSEGCFYTCRKMLKRDTEEDKKWFRNDSNSVWILESNESFNRPSNWDKVVEHSVKALKGVGLDFGAVDLRIQSATDGKNNIRKDPDFIVVEINSAPSFGQVTAEKYIEEIPKMLQRKYECSI